MRAGAGNPDRAAAVRLARVIVAAVLAAALSAEPVPAQSSRTDRDLVRVRAQIARLRKQLQRVRKEARTAEQQLKAIDLQRAILSRELHEAVVMTRELERQKGDTAADIARLTGRIDVQQKYLAARLAALYRLGSLSYLRIVLSLDQKKNPFEAAAMLRYLINRDAKAVKQYQETKASLAERHAELAARQTAINESRRLVAQHTAALQRTRAEQARLLAQLNSESTESAQKLAELEEKARRLERLFQLLYQRADSASTARIDEFKGALAWPVAGNVVETFGPKRSARFATVTVSNGLKIEADLGSEVRAVFEGTVVFSQWFKGYGNLVILDHGDRIFSLYGNTRGGAVNAGDKIAAGQVIGQVAEGEDGPSAYLYFEIREDNKPVDPQTWLR